MKRQVERVCDQCQCVYLTRQPTRQRFCSIRCFWANCQRELEAARPAVRAVTYEDIAAAPTGTESAA